jgi:Xaa-Pro aminopeptidase
VEPGLYYPEIGGVRLEDMVAVTESGCENFTHFERTLVL